MDNFEVLQGTALPLVVTIRDSVGDPIASYTGAEPLSSACWPGGDRASAFAPAAGWLKPGAGTISVAVAAAQTSSLAPGRWRGEVTLVDPAAGPVLAYAWTMDVLQAPGSAAAPPAYCSFADMLDQGQGWLRTLQGRDVDEGFGRARGRSRSWLDALVVSRWQGATRGGTDITSGDLGRGSAADSWIQRQLDAGGLILTPQLVEAAAKKAVAYVCEAQLGPAAGPQDFAALGRHYHREAEAIAKTLRVGMNPDPRTGLPSFLIHIGTIASG